ncbi:hypothetical protein A5738_07865 [Mycobacterium colombiense]|nr:hypothetical protein A5738_07865 [Mycobacterium colombiense]
MNRNSTTSPLVAITSSFGRGHLTGDVRLLTALTGRCSISAIAFAAQSFAFARRRRALAFI